MGVDAKVGTENAGDSAGVSGASPRSLRRIRPEGPVPTTLERSTPRSRATLRASGLAKIRPPLEGLAGVGVAAGASLSSTGFVTGSG